MLVEISPGYAVEPANIEAIGETIGKDKSFITEENPEGQSIFVLWKSDHNTITIPGKIEDALKALDWRVQKLSDTTVQRPPEPDFMREA